MEKIKLIGNRLLVSKVEEEKSDGFKAVDIQDNFLYKGKVEHGEYLNKIVLFRKYSPDTEEVELDGRKYKIINLDDVLGIYE